MADVFESLLETQSCKLPRGDFLLAYDRRKKLKLPMAPVETGPMWHSQQKVALSCWGGVCAKHTASSTEEKSFQRLSYVFLLFIADVVEQTAEASNIMLQTDLDCWNLPTTGTLQLWSDTGPHFRSAENLYFAAGVLPSTRKQNIRFLAEQHGKSILDKMFTWTGVHKMGRLAQKQPIYDVDAMRRAFEVGAKEQARKDPAGPKWIAKKVCYPEKKAAFLLCKISQDHSYLSLRC